MSKNDLIGSIVGIIGFVIVGMFSNWLVSLGVFLMIFGNNLERSNERL